MIFAGTSVDPVTGRDFIRAYKAKMGYAPGIKPVNRTTSCG